MGLSLCKLYHARPPDGSGHCMEVGTMPYSWPQDTDFAQWELDVIDRNCRVCGRMMHVCDHRYRRFHTLEGPVELVCKLNHCPDRGCQGHTHTKSPELEITIAPPSGQSGGMSSVGSVIAGARGTGRFPRSRPIFGTITTSGFPTTPSASMSNATKSCSPRGSKTRGGSAAAIPNRR